MVKVDRISVTAAQELSRKRALLEDGIEHLIGILDKLDRPDEDIEDDADAEAILTKEGWSG